jgi:hypothetical protein
MSKPKLQTIQLLFSYKRSRLTRDEIFSDVGELFEMRFLPDHPYVIAPCALWQVHKIEVS